MSSFKEFRAELSKRNVARLNQYEVVINPPPGFAVDSDILKLINMWCSFASTPQTSIFTNDSYVEAGNRRKFAYNHDTNNLFLHFYGDQDNKIKDFFNQWIDSITPRNRRFAWPDSYTSDSIVVYVLNRESERVYQYKYARCFPKMITSVEFGHGSNNHALQFGVEFVFEWVECNDMGPKDLLPRTMPSKSENIEVQQTQPMPDYRDYNYLNGA